MKPQLTLDDGADLIFTVHTKHTEYLNGLEGGTEETTTGIHRISVDGPFANLAFKNANNINFPLLCDINKLTLKAFDHYQENFGGIKGYTVSKRAAYVLDKDSVVRFKWVSDSPGVEPDYATLAREAEKVKAL